MRSFTQQGRELIFQITDLLFQVRDLRANAIVVGFSLRHGCHVALTGIHQGTGGFDVHLPQFFRFLADGQLVFQHGQRVVIVGDCRNQLRLYGLFVSLAVLKLGLRTLFGIVQASEDVYLPRG